MPEITVMDVQPITADEALVLAAQSGRGSGYNRYPLPAGTVRALVFAAALDKPEYSDVQGMVDGLVSYSRFFADPAAIQVIHDALATVPDPSGLVAGLSQILLTVAEQMQSVKAVQLLVTLPTVDVAGYQSVLAVQCNAVPVAIADTPQE